MPRFAGPPRPKSPTDIQRRPGQLQPQNGVQVRSSKINHLALVPTQAHPSRACPRRISADLSNPGLAIAHRSPTTLGEPTPGVHNPNPRPKRNMSISHSPASTAESPCTSPVDAPLFPDPLLPATPTYGEGREVLYNNRHRIRVLPIDGTPFFCVADVADALGWKPAVVLSIAQGPDVPAFMRAIAAEAPDPDILGQPQDQVVVSSAGLFILSHAVDDPVRAQNLVALA